MILCVLLLFPRLPSFMSASLALHINDQSSTFYQTCESQKSVSVSEGEERWWSDLSGRRMSPGLENSLTVRADLVLGVVRGGCQTEMTGVRIHLRPVPVRSDLITSKLK